jgi:hypothetical protein
MQIINETSPGQDLGAMLGSGLASGLQEYARQKLDKVESNRVYDYLKMANPSMPNEHARAISKLPREYQSEVLKYTQQQKGSEALGQYLNAMAGLGGGGSGQGSTYQSTAPTSSPSNVTSMAQKFAPSAAPAQQFAPGSFQDRFQKTNAAAGYIPGAPQPKVPASNQPMRKGAPIDFSGLNTQQLMQAAQIGQSIQNSNVKNQQFERKLAQQGDQFEKNLGVKERTVDVRERIAGTREQMVKQGAEKVEMKKTELQRNIAKDWGVIDKKYSEQYKSAKKLKEDFHLMRGLATTGKIRTPNQTAAAKMFGVNEFGRNFQTQAVEKLAAGIVSEDIRAMGSAAKVFAEQVALKARPGLLNDPLTMDVLAEMGENAQEYKMIESKAYMDFIRSHKNDVIPGDIESQVSLSPEVQRAADDRERKNEILVEYANAKLDGNYVDTMPPARKYKDWQQFKQKDGTFLTKRGGTVNPKWYPGYRENARSDADRV